MTFALSAQRESADIDLVHTLIEWDTQDRDDHWLVSYADIVSTLLAMVVLLFGRVAMTSTAAAAPAPEAAVVATAAMPVEPAPTPAPELEILPDPEPPLTALVPEPGPEDRLAALVEERFAGRIQAARRDEGLVLTIPEVALFDSARAELQPSASALLAELAATLDEAGDAQIAVEGHTDDRPVTGGPFDSNWDLAAARANAVTRYLLEHGFDARRVHSVSYADTRPAADNATPEGRATNRRVQITIDFGA